MFEDRCGYSPAVNDVRKRERRPDPQECCPSCDEALTSRAYNQAGPDEEGEPQLQRQYRRCVSCLLVTRRFFDTDWGEWQVVDEETLPPRVKWAVSLL